MSWCRSIRPPNPAHQTAHTSMAPGRRRQRPAGPGPAAHRRPALPSRPNDAISPVGAGRDRESDRVEAEEHRSGEVAEVPDVVDRQRLVEVHALPTTPRGGCPGRQTDDQDEHVAQCGCSGGAGHPRTELGASSDGPGQEDDDRDRGSGRRASARSRRRGPASATPRRTSARLPAAPGGRSESLGAPWWRTSVPGARGRASPLPSTGSRAAVPGSRGGAVCRAPGSSPSLVRGSRSS